MHAGTSSWWQEKLVRIQCLTLKSKLRIYLCKIPTVITELDSVKQDYIHKFDFGCILLWFSIDSFLKTMRFRTVKWSTRKIESHSQTVRVSRSAISSTHTLSGWAVLYQNHCQCYRYILIYNSISYVGLVRLVFQPMQECQDSWWCM